MNPRDHTQPSHTLIPHGGVGNPLTRIVPSCATPPPHLMSFNVVGGISPEATPIPHHRLCRLSHDHRPTCPPPVLVQVPAPQQLRRRPVRLPSARSPRGAAAGSILPRPAGPPALNTHRPALPPSLNAGAQLQGHHRSTLTPPPLPPPPSTQPEARSAAE